MIEMVRARVGVAVCVEGGSPPPSGPTVHQSARSTPSVFPSHPTPTSVRGTLSPFCCLGFRPVPFGSVPFRSTQSSLVQSSVPRPCTRARATHRARAHATQRARHPEPLRTHTQPGHGTPRTPISG